MFAPHSHRYETNPSVILAKDSIRNDSIAQLLQRRQEYDERENNRALNEFRALHQQPAAQRNEDNHSRGFLQSPSRCFFRRRMGFK